MTNLPKQYLGDSINGEIIDDILHLTKDYSDGRVVEICIDSLVMSELQDYWNDYVDTLLRESKQTV